MYSTLRETGHWPTGSQRHSLVGLASRYRSVDLESELRLGSARVDAGAAARCCPGSLSASLSKAAPDFGCMPGSFPSKRACGKNASLVALGGSHQRVAPGAFRYPGLPHVADLNSGLPFCLAVAWLSFVRSLQMRRPSTAEARTRLTRAHSTAKLARPRPAQKIYAIFGQPGWAERAGASTARGSTLKASKPKYPFGFAPRPSEVVLKSRSPGGVKRLRLMGGRCVPL